MKSILPCVVEKGFYFIGLLIPNFIEVYLAYAIIKLLGGLIAVIGEGRARATRAAHRPIKLAGIYIVFIEPIF